MSHPAKLLCLTLVFLLPMAAMAQKPKQDDTQAYAEIKVADLSFDNVTQRLLLMLAESFGAGPITVTREEPPDYGLLVTEGVDFAKYLSTEVTLAYYGSAEIEGTSAEGVRHKIKSDLYSGHINLAAAWPVTKSLELYGKAGINWSYSTNKLTIFPADGDLERDGRDFNEVNAVYGAGARYQLGAYFMSVDWTDTRVDKMDLSALNFGIGVRY